MEGSWRVDRQLQLPKLLRRIRGQAPRSLAMACCSLMFTAWRRPFVLQRTARLAGKPVAHALGPP